MIKYDPDPLGLDKDIENMEIPECDWKLIGKLSMEFHEIERLFGPVPNKYKKYFNSIYAMSASERKRKIKKAKASLRKKGMIFSNTKE
jgi:hypothetical protein